MVCNYDDVGNFHERFDLDNTTHHPEGPRDVPEDVMDFRIVAMREELQEFEDARAAGDVAGMADALVDLVYFVMGTAHLMGLPWQALWDEVHRANMAKVRAAPDGSDSKRHSKWDVVKPDGWTAPDIEGVLARHGW